MHKVYAFKVLERKSPSKVIIAVYLRSLPNIQNILNYTVTLKNPFIIANTESNKAWFFFSKKLNASANINIFLTK